MRLCRTGVVAAFLVGIGLVAPAAARGDCLRAARKVHAAKSGQKGCFFAKTGERADASRADADGGGCAEIDGTGVVYYFEDQAQADKAARNLGLDPSPLESLARCPGLWVVNRPASASEPVPDPVEIDRGPGRLGYPRGSAREILEGYGQEEAHGVLPTNVVRGTGGAADVAAEALQILGQIVVDRATQAAYELIGTKIREGLGCAAPDGGGSQRFPATCEALDTLRIQDLAMARQVLLRAMVSDVAAVAFRAAGSSSEAIARGLAAPLRGAGVPARGAASVTEPELRRAAGRAAEVMAMAGPLLDSIVATVADPARTRHGSTARAIADEIVSFSFSHSDDGHPSIRPFLLASAALLKCTSGQESGSELADCPISQLVDQMRERDGERVMAVARAVARGLLAAITATEGQARDPSPRARLSAAVGGLFDGVCFALAPGRGLGCPPILDASSYPAGHYVAGLSVARGVIEAAIDEDSNRMFASIAAGLQTLDGIWAEKAAAMTGRERRALRLLAGVVQYSGTYGKTGDGAASDEEKHRQRTKILESLTADMTRRTGREGDTIISVGGSLALVGGMRFGSGDHIWASPFALTLGLGVQHVASPGLHVELGFVDLAQYFALEEETTMTAGGGEQSSIVVTKPELQDALSPSVKVGLQWGRDVPFYVAAMAGYSPFYEFAERDGTSSRSGSWNVGLVMGAYVPLIDAN